MRQSVLADIFSIVAVAQFKLGAAFIPPMHHQVVQVASSRQPSYVQQRTDARPTSSERSSSGSSTSSSTSSSTREAKESFIRNLERKRAGEDVPSSILDSDLARLRSMPIGVVDSTPTTTVGNLESWGGRWRVCHAPHIDTLGGVLLTSFPSIEYDFQPSDGGMVSHVRYENKVFGSGWLNADGKVVPVKQSLAGDSIDSGVRPKEVVKVVFERFWWDRNGEEQPRGTPPAVAKGEPSAELEGSSGLGGLVDWFVQAVGKATFFDGLSVFPVRYLDDDLCVFEFKAAGTVVASQRVAD